MDRNALWPYSLALARVRSTRAAFLIRRGSILTCIYMSVHQSVIPEQHMQPE